MFLDPSLGSAAHRQMPWVPLAYLQVPSDGHVLFWELRDILLFASAPNSAPSLLFAAESGQLQAAASSDLSPGSRLWPGAPRRLAQDQ